MVKQSWSKLGLVDHYPQVTFNCQNKIFLKKKKKQKLPVPLPRYFERYGVSLGFSGRRWAEKNKVGAETISIVPRSFLSQLPLMVPKCQYLYACISICFSRAIHSCKQMTLAGAMTHFHMSNCHFVHTGKDWSTCRGPAGLDPMHWAPISTTTMRYQTLNWHQAGPASFKMKSQLL
jgi:hypothetical protein